MKRKEFMLKSKSDEKLSQYKLNLVFNGKKITKLTITDHYQEKHSDISHELIILLIKLLDGLRLDESNYQGSRKVYKWAKKYQDKSYRLIFWYDDEDLEGLWVRNCYRID